MGLAATVVLIVGAAVAGSAPTTSDSADRALLMTQQHRGKYLASMWIIGFGMALSLAFVVALIVIARRDDRSDQPWTTVALAAASATFALGAAGVASASSAAYRADTLSADSARSLWDLYAAMINVSNIMTIVLAAAIALLVFATRFLPAWVGWSSVVVAVAHVVASLSLARDGAFSPSGVFGLAAGFVFLAWMAAVSIVLLRRPRALADV